MRSGLPPHAPASTTSTMTTASTTSQSPSQTASRRASLQPLRPDTRGHLEHKVMNVQDAGAHRRLDKYQWTENNAQCSVTLNRTQDGRPESLSIVDYRPGEPHEGEDAWETFNVAATDLPDLCSYVEVAPGRTAEVGDLAYLLSRIGSVQGISQFLDGKGIAYKRDFWIDNDN